MGKLATGISRSIASSGRLAPVRESVRLRTFPESKELDFRWDGLYPLADTPGLVLTDDFNPLETIEEDSRERMRRRALEAIPAEVRDLVLAD